VKILVAEDDATSLLILHRAVEKAGHECVAASNGEEAWRLYKETPGLHAIISDWMMPDVDGLELCRRVRAGEREGYTYFIFLTALGDKEHLLQGFEAGADDYLSKPLNRAELEMRLISARRLTALHERLDEQRAELERLNGLLADQARTDPLTGLGNRLRMREDLEVLVARAKRYGQGYGVILCDVDCFKLYNDTQGHLAGDEVLRKVAEALSETVRMGDTVYRYGGEEFLALLPEQTVEASRQAAERLRHVVERLGIPHEARSHPSIITISAGVSSTLSSAEAGDSKTSDDMLKDADEELYKAKEAGRNLVFARSGDP
jgi:two-component system chemotaxis response regulator CheY